MDLEADLLEGCALIAVVCMGELGQGGVWYD